MKVAAGILKKDNSVLLMRRAQGHSCAGEWEYPGGKFEPGETGPECLKRELQEELSINANIGKLISVTTGTTDKGKIELYAYEVLSYTGDIKLIVHDNMEWVKIDSLLSHPQLPNDLLISQKLKTIF